MSLTIVPSDTNANENMTPEQGTRHRRGVDRIGHRREALGFAQAYRDRLHIVATTTSPSGLPVDWIPIESQGEIAAPPPPVRENGRAAGRPERRADPELADAQRGPAGTVPVARPLVERMSLQRSMADIQSKYRRGRLLARGGAPLALPQEGADHLYASSGQDVTCYGGEGAFSVFDPYVEAPDQFSLIQIGLSNDDLGHLQTVEAGWQEFHDLRGDWVPHLFTFFTTNGYAESGDDLGGYNQTVGGWVQYDDTIFPGTTFTPYSDRGGAQRKIDLKYQLYEGNWWLCVQGTWIGYYPGSLFSGSGQGLAGHAGWIGFWGEVADPTKIGVNTKTDMGSGYYAEAGWSWAAYMHNLRVQTDRDGRLEHYDGSDSQLTTDDTKYDLDAHWREGGSWGSYTYLGGPGAG